METSSFVKFIISKFFKTLKNPRKLHISKTIRFWAVIFRGKIHNPWEYPKSFQLQDGELQKFWMFLKINFLKNFEKKIVKKQRNISKTTKIWEVRFGGQICNPESTLTAPTTKLGNSNFEKKISFWDFWKIHQKTSYLEKGIWAVIFRGKIRNSWEYPDKASL